MSVASPNATLIGNTGISDPALLLYSRMNLLSAVMAPLGLGMQAIVYFAVVRVLWRSKTHGRTRWILLAIVTALMLLNLINTVLIALSIEDFYIDNPFYPGGFGAYAEIASSLPVNILSLACYVIGTLVADALLLWRTWQIFIAVGNRRSLIFIFPAFAIYILSIVISVFLQLNSAAAGQQLYGTATVHYATIFFASSFATNVYLTLIITARIWTYQRNGRHLLGRDFGKAYTTLYSIFIESAAMYSVVAVGVFVTFDINTPYNQIFISLAPAIQDIASNLIVYRVAQGRSWEATHGTSGSMTGSGTGMGSGTMRFRTRGTTTGTGTGATTDINMDGSTVKFESNVFGDAEAQGTARYTYTDRDAKIGSRDAMEFA